MVLLQICLSFVLALWRSSFHMYFFPVFICIFCLHNNMFHLVLQYLTIIRWYVRSHCIVGMHSCPRGKYQTVHFNIYSQEEIIESGVSLCAREYGSGLVANYLCEYTCESGGLANEAANFRREARWLRMNNVTSFVPFYDSGFGTTY